MAFCAVGQFEVEFAFSELGQQRRTVMHDTDLPVVGGEIRVYDINFEN